MMHNMAFECMVLPNRSKRKREWVKFRESLTPWMKEGYAYPSGVMGLHEEIEDFYSWMVPTSLEHMVRLDVVRRIKETVFELWPGSRVEVSGSFRTGLYLPTSDIDLVVCGKWESLPFRTMERALLQKQIAHPASLKVLDKAAVPIVKFIDIRSRIKVDISFNMSNGVRAAELIKHFKKRYPPLPKLIYVLKQFLFQRDLNEVFTGGLSSYSLILLVISFLQHHYSPETVSSGKANLGVMLIEFLELYGRSFNFRGTAIRIKDGGSYVPKEQFQKSMMNSYTAALLSIEDPFDPTNDVGRSSYGFYAVQRSFERAYIVLTTLVIAGAPVADGKSILNSVVEVSKDISAYRNWMNETFSFLFNPYAYSEGYLFPSTPQNFLRMPLEFITPRQLPNSHYPVEEKKEKQPDTPPSAAGNNSVCNDSNLSSISNRVCPSQSSPISLSSDTESEGLNSVAITPHSEMSISPANSEIGGSVGKINFKRDFSSKNSYGQKHCPSSSPVSSGKKSHFVSQGGDPEIPVEGSLRGTSGQDVKLRSTMYWNSGKSIKEGRRSDSTLNWRSPERSKRASSSEKSTSHVVDTSKTSSKIPPSSTSVNIPYDSRADRDSNWRNREQPKDKNADTDRDNSTSQNANNNNNNSHTLNKSVNTTKQKKKSKKKNQNKSPAKHREQEVKEVENPSLIKLSEAETKTKCDNHRNFPNKSVIPSTKKRKKSHLKIPPPVQPSLKSAEIIEIPNRFSPKARLGNSKR